ncbi:hypothetical protein ACJQWK_09544 [Exserohilum turcicum]
MNIAAPTFNSLNKPQKRALILRDQLRFVDPLHLDEFLDGVSNHEPPAYTRVNGVIKPDLTFVTLKEEATRFDLGNVLLAEENNAIYRVYLVVENGQIQMQAEDPLPRDDEVLDSIPIHGFIARSTVPLFREKFQAIHARMTKINEARRAAYNMPAQEPTLVCEGETIARLDPSRAEQGRPSLQPNKARKRAPNEKILPHISNKRKRTSLDIIPASTKSRTLDTLPNHVKIDLFNSIVQTAFPNFEDLMTACWNVISIYTACGTDFPELHRAIVELKGVLLDFEHAFGHSGGERETPRYRRDFEAAERVYKGKERDAECEREGKPSARGVAGDDQVHVKMDPEQGNASGANEAHVDAPAENEKQTGNGHDAHHVSCSAGADARSEKSQIQHSAEHPLSDVQKQSMGAYQAPPHHVREQHSTSNRGTHVSRTLFHATATMSPPPRPASASTSAPAPARGGGGGGGVGGTAGTARTGSVIPPPKPRPTDHTPIFHDAYIDSLMSSVPPTRTPRARIKKMRSTTPNPTNPIPSTNPTHASSGSGAAAAAAASSSSSSSSFSFPAISGNDHGKQSGKESVSTNGHEPANEASSGSGSGSGNGNGNSVFGVCLGNSVLGAKKARATPVPDMVSRCDKVE